MRNFRQKTPVLSVFPYLPLQLLYPLTVSDGNGQTYAVKDLLALASGESPKEVVADDPFAQAAERARRDHALAALPHDPAHLRRA